MRFDGKTNKQKAVELNIQKVSVCDKPAHEFATSRIIKAASKWSSKEEKKKKGAQEMKKEEVDAMVKKAVETLEKKLAISEAVAKMSDDVKAYYNGLDDEKKQEFIKKSAEEQKTLSDPVRDEVITSNGVTIRKSAVGPEIFSFMKSQQEEIKKAQDIAKIEKEKRELKEFTEQAEKLYPNLPGDPIKKGLVVKQLYNLPEETRQTLQTMLKSGNTALEDAKLFLEIGSSSSSLQQGSALERLDQLAIQKSKEMNITKEKAYSDILKTKEGYELYQESKSGKIGR